MNKIKSNEKKQEKIMGLGLLMFASLIVHVILAVAYEGYETDMQCFSWWSNAVFENGVSKFYSLSEFTDYPPGYMYILYVIGAIRKVMGITGMETASILLLKLPAILCDLGIGFVIYKVASRYTSFSNALIITAAFIFNPCILINSATWGQVDSVFTLCIVLMIYFITEKKLPAAYFVFALGILIKPQSMFFGPVLIYGIVDQVFLNNFTWKRMFTQLSIGISAIGALFLAAAPFGLSTVISQYIDTVGSYEYASVNAYNFWVLLGDNWKSQDDMFIFMSFKQWGTLFIIVAIVLSALYCFRNKESESKYYLTGGLLMVTIFMLSVRMHERYMYPALALILIGASVKRNYKWFVAYGALCVIHFMNVYHVLFYYDHNTYDFDNPVLPAIAFCSMCAFVYMLIVFYKQGNVPMELTFADRQKAKNSASTTGRKGMERGTNGKNNRKNNSRIQEYDPETRGYWRIRKSHVSAKWTKFDFVAIAVITIIYAAVAFWRLGDMKAPETEWSGKQWDEISLDFGESVNVDKMFGFLGCYESRKFEVTMSEDGINWTKYTSDSTDEDGSDNAKFTSVFAWNEIDLNNTFRYIKFTQLDDKALIKEFMFYNADGNVLTPVNTSDYPELFDEQDIFDGKYSFMNSTYFDEIYHARTAYEMIHGMYCYENTHPPLGKAIMAIGILIFGMCPFGWRFMGTLFGVLMLPVMYLIAKKMTDKTWLSTVIMALFALDFMHFSQTRIATIDVFVTLFIMLEYYFMLSYYRMSFYDTPLKKTFVPLALSGFFMGLGFGAKWTGIYAGAGLAVIFFAVILRRYMEYKKASMIPGGNTEGIEHKHVIASFKDNTLKTICFCVVAFVVVPFILYLMAYIPYNDGSERGLFGRMVASQQTMYSYHSNLVAEHPYSSTWYEWPTIARPILYYNEDIGNNLHEGISSMGNPAIWWVGIAALLFMFYLFIKKKDRMSFFFIVGYFAQYMPWMLVSRCTFIYHYFPSVPFLVMMIGYSMYVIIKEKPKLKPVVFVYLFVALALFVLFFPVISGYPATLEYAKYLKWFSRWALLF